MDGAVQGEAQGQADSVEKLLTDISTGPPHAKVDRLENEQIDTKEGETGFQVLRSPK
ncbi:hypothetical protein FQN57_002662 [Myotisia sp. PD_48]|nr:hypothetical protein FQN57_002662 [Myotisia sp. PD_48]